MTKPVTGLTQFATLSGSQPASLLDGAFVALSGAINEALNYSNGADDSGAVDAYVVNFPAGITVTLSRYLRIQFVPQNTNSGPATVNVGGTGAISIVNQSGTSLTGGEMPAGRVIEVIFDGTNWQLSVSPLSGASGIPVGTMMPYSGSSAPTGYLLCQGQAVSRVTYAALFAVTGVVYGAGDGSTTFNLPDTRGRSPIGIGTGTRTYNVTNANTTTGSPGLFTVPLNNTTWLTGMPVLLTLTSGTITGLSSGATYYVIRQSGLTISLATTLANAQAGVGTNWSAKSSPVGTLVYTLTLRSLGEDGGEEAHAQTGSEVGPHTHNVPARLGGAIGSTQVSLMSNTSDNGTIPVTTVGGGAAANTMQPFLGLNYIIKT